MAQKRATVTLYRYYYKSIEIEIDEEYLKGLTEEEIAVKLVGEEIPYDAEAVQEAPIEETDAGENYETDRYDIYDEEGDHIYGGHL